MEWNPCSLSSREQLSEKFTKLTFVLKDNTAKFDLKLGQELILCISDADGKVLKQTFFPTSVAKESFEVVYQHSNSYVESTATATQEFSKQLDFMLDKDEAGFKGGQSRIVYKGNEDPIRSLTVVAVGLGITPAIQLLKTVFGDSSTSIEEFEVLWMNERKSDFVLNDYVETLELKQMDQIFVTRVVDIDIYQEETKINEKVQGAVTPFEPGRVAMFLGPANVRPKALDFLQNMGYIRDHIVDISTS